MKLLIAIMLILPMTLLAQDEENLPYIQRDSFVSNAFGFQVSIANFKKNYSGLLTITKKPVRNKYDSSIVDTVYSFTKGKTKIEIYHSRERDLLQSAYIVTENIPLKYNIKVGNTKADIAKLLKAKITKDKVQVGDLEHGQVYTFSFAKNRLIAISYEGYLE
jgi:hypothetical protein